VAAEVRALVAAVIASGDPVATELFRTFKQQRMPDWTDLSPQDVNAILGLAGRRRAGTEAGRRTRRRAGAAADVARRARCSTDERRSRAAGCLRGLPQPCATTIARRAARWARPDRHVPEVPRSRADAAAAPPVHAAPARAERGRYLEPQEAFALKAYLRDVALAASPFTTYPITEANEDNHERTRAQLRVSRLALPGADAGAAGFTSPAADRRSPARRAARAAARARVFWAAGWRASWALLVAAHAAGLLFPRAILRWTRAPWRCWRVEAAGSRSASRCWRPACAPWQHVRRPRGGWSLVADLRRRVFLSLLFIGVASGCWPRRCIAGDRSGRAVTVAPTRRRCCTAGPTPAFVEHLPLLVRLHLFTAFAAIASSRHAAGAAAAGARARRARARGPRARRGRGPARPGCAASRPRVAVAGSRSSLAAKALAEDAGRKPRRPERRRGGTVRGRGARGATSTGGKAV
jgi:hypothetical protein